VFLALIAAGAALVAAYWNSQVAKQGQQADLFLRAGQQLASNDALTRIDGIQSLERLGEDSSRYLPTVEQLLQTYLRKYAAWRGTQTRLSGDAQAALTALANLRALSKKVKVGALDLSGLDLEYADLTGAHLEGVGFWGTHLEHANLSDAHLDGAWLLTAHLENAIMAGASMTCANLTAAKLDGAELDGAILRQANLSQASLVSAGGFSMVAPIQFEQANLSWANLQKAPLENANFKDAVLLGADFRGANLWDAHLEGAILNQANLEGAAFLRTHLEGAHLAAGNVEVPGLPRCDPLFQIIPMLKSWAQLTPSGTSHRKQTLKDAIGLTREQVKEATLDKQTQLPDYLKGP
jgi:uncharacterized protein YjbI with pentapeptide repeats